ncbi:MAG TPA: peptidoglycan DD-metalloendopeptidase family protein [Saprospiraceae bacterium]|nr:peptidoglycan DD-metalloendopeptidase family protein [Saprospiraceae bacterium]
MSKTNQTKQRKLNKSTLLLILGLSLFTIAASVLIFQLQAKEQIKASVADTKIELSAFPAVVPNIRYGFALDTFQVKQDTIRSGEFLGTILAKNKMRYTDIDELVKNAKGTFNVSSLRVNRPYLLLNKDTTTAPDYFIYEPNVYAYYVFDLKNKQVEKIEHPVSYESKNISGVIESSLWTAMTKANASPALFAKMEDALQWSIDFTRIQKGDQFKLVYDQEFIDGKKVGVGMVHAAYYKTENNEFHAVYFDDKENPNNTGYYDLEGRPLNSGFLKSPIKSSNFRISSSYNLRRFHPILKRVKPHYGTDYAAPYGTPIQAVGGGVVTRSGYTKGNGNFVKIKHDDTYSTQYLHMQKFASGIKVGTHVKQGQVIGYVGSTGLATGPHVCFRFWKNGRQVNHRALQFPPAEPLSKDLLPAFIQLKDRYLEQLNTLPLQELPSEEEEMTEIPVEEAEASSTT